MPLIILLGSLWTWCCPGQPAYNVTLQRSRFAPEWFLTWQKQTNKVYRLQVKNNLNDEEWSDVRGDVVVTCRYFDATKPLLVTNYRQRFYRVREAGDVGSVPFAFQGDDGRWRRYDQYSLGSAEGAGIFISRSGVVLEGGQVIDGPVTTNRVQDHLALLEELKADERVDFVYPVYTTTNQAYEARAGCGYSPQMTAKLYGEITDDLRAMLASEHVAVTKYLPNVNLYFWTLTQPKEDDPFEVAKRLRLDPRIEFVDLGGCARLRDPPCVSP